MPNIPIIKFSHEWSKLDCAEGSLFTTIRSFDSSGNKAAYYENLEGETFMVKVNGKYRFMAVLLQVFRGTGKDLSGPLLKYDTDGNADWIDRITGYPNVLVLVFRKVKQ